MLGEKLIAQCNITVSYSKTDYECSGGPSVGGFSSPILGTITASPQNGTAPYQFKVNNGTFQSSNFFNNLTPGTYSLFVQDATNCLDSLVVNISTPPQPIINAVNTTSSSCVPGCDGTMEVQVSGGTPPYQYAKDYSQFGPIFQTSNQFSSLCSSGYTITVVDSNGCYTNTTASILNPVPTPITITNITQPSCTPGCDGTATVSLFPGAVYTIVPSGGPINSLTGLATGLCASTSYVVVATDANGCFSSTSLLMYNINTPPQISIPYILHPTCANGNDGEIVILGMSNNPAISYDIYPQVMGYNSGDTLKGLSANNYTIVASDINGCYTATTVTLTLPTPLSISISSIINPTCINGNDGQIVIAGMSNNPTISYNIYPQALGPNAGDTLKGLSANNYTIVATDANGCYTTTTVTLTFQPTPPINISSVINPTCSNSANGSITIPGASANSFLNVYYVLYPGGIGFGFPTMSNLNAGTYTIVANYFSGCSTSTTVSLTANAAPMLSIFNTTNSCFNFCNGTAQITSNVAVNYTIAGVGNPTINANGFASNLCANSNYTITATDLNGCTNQLLVNVASEPNLQINISSIKPTICSFPNSGSFVLQNYSNNQNITYTISPTVNYTVNNDTIFGLNTGTYTVAATSSIGCSSTAVIYIPTSLPQLTLNASTSTTCENKCNGIVSLTASNIHPSMKIYSLYSGISTSILDSVSASVGIFQNCCYGPNYFQIQHNGCVSNIISTFVSYDLSIPKPKTSEIYPCLNQNNGSIRVDTLEQHKAYSLSPMPQGAVIQSPGYFINLPKNNYFLRILDTMSNCLISKYIPMGSGLNFRTINQTCLPNSTCNGILIMRPINANLPFSYTLNPNNNIIQLNDSVFSGFCIDSTYQITVTDAIGCVFTRLVNIQNASISLDYNKQNPFCNTCNGSITSNTDSPFPPFNFHLEGTNFTQSNSNGTFSGLCKDNYTLSVTDSMGFCSEKIFSLQPIQVQIYTAEDSCFGACKGKAMFNLSGTPGSYNLTLTPATGTQTGNTFSNLCAGNYSLHISNLTPCSLDTVFTITEPAKVQLIASSILPTVCSLPNGQIHLTTSGTRGNWTFNTFPGNSTDSTIINLPSNTYVCSVVDAYQCKDSLTIVINDTIPDFIDTILTGPTSCIEADGSLWVYLKQNNPYNVNSFSLNSIDWTSQHYFEYLNSGKYNVFTKTIDGCIDSTTATVGFKNNLQLENLQFETEQCTGTNDGAILLPDNDFIYSIEPNFNVDHENRIIPNLPLGTYTLTASDSRGCTGSKVVEILAAAPLVLQTKILNNTYGDCHGEVQIIAEGGTPPYTFQAEPSNFAVVSDSGKLNYLCNTDYSITVTDKLGCQQTQQIFIPYQDLDGDDFSIFPNPANNELNFLFSRIVDVVITLTDVSGRTIEQHILNDQTKISLPLTRYESGIYFLTLRFDDQQFIRKIQIQH